ncbi:MAG TPA: hypothetical protein DDW52_28105 [Planctomycetaceae bacterium]|nr:hypothetical protein [Planctomycetaceae bacterium]
MNRIAVLSLSIVTFAALGKSHAQVIDAKIDQQLVSVGDQVTMTLKGQGRIGIENDIAGMSSEIQVSGSKTIDLGRIKAPGLYAVRLYNGKKKPLAFAIAALPREGSAKLDILNRSKQINSSEPLDAEVLKRFWKGATADRIEKAARAALPDWLAANAAGIGTTAVTCTICVVPGGQAACPVCIESAAINTISLSLDIIKKLAEIEAKDGILTKGEAKRLAKVLQVGQSLGAVLSASGKLDKALELTAAAVEFSVDNFAVKAAVMNGKDEVSKTYLLIRILKK